MTTLSDDHPWRPWHGNRVVSPAGVKDPCGQCSVPLEGHPIVAFHNHDGLCCPTCGAVFARD